MLKLNINVRQKKIVNCDVRDPRRNMRDKQISNDKHDYKVHFTLQRDELSFFCSDKWVLNAVTRNAGPSEEWISNTHNNRDGMITI